MPQFTYQAMDASGREVSGSLEAADRPTLLKQLAAKGLQAFKVAEGASAAAKGKAAPAAKAAPGSKSATGARVAELPTGPIKLSAGQVLLFTEEVSELLEAGMRLEPALKLMEGKNDANPAPYRIVARRVGDLVREGHPFSNAIRMASPSFGELFYSVAAAGEAGGSLGEAMRRQAQYQAASREMRGKVIVALIYPAFLAVAGMAVTALFVTYLIPKLMGLINTSRSKPPALAKFMMAFSEALKNYWPVFLISIAVVVIGFILFIRSPAGKPVWHKLKLQLPFVGGVLRASLHAQFLETLASLSGGGLPLLRGMELASRVTTNIYAEEQLKKSIDAVRDGGAVSRALERTGLFPSNLVEMVRLGEHTGDLPAALRRAADRCARELGRSLEKAAAAIQPLIILLMAGIVGVMAYLMISIIFDTINSMNKPRSKASFQPTLQHIQRYEDLA